VAKKNRFEGLTCYACAEPACGDEHAPPESIFPKGKREHLIKVPSCRKHNQDKNLEDELIKAIVVMSSDKSPDAMEVLESVIRAMEKDPKKMKLFLPSPRPVRMNGANTMAFRIDTVRFERAIKLMTQALWFKETGQQLLAELLVFWPHLRLSDLQEHPALVPLRKVSNAWPASDYKGCYPEVFRHDFHDGPDPEGGILWVCRLCFYGGMPIIVSWTVMP